MRGWGGRGKGTAAALKVLYEHARIVGTSIECETGFSEAVEDLRIPSLYFLGKIDLVPLKKRYGAGHEEEVCILQRGLGDVSV
jgi:hypothetical protein